MKQYRFYGWAQADCAPVSGKYPGIGSPKQLYDALLQIWCAETCAPRLRDSWRPENPTLGQCSITAFLVQDIFGGRVYGVLRPGGNYHCYNVVGDRKFDLTSEQFGGETLCYDGNPEQFREVHFAKAEKRQRYEQLCAALKAYCSAQRKEASMRILTAYFSAGGVTKQVAQRLAKAVGAEEFEIVPQEPYSEADIKWVNPLARCNREKLGKKDVPFVGAVDNIRDFDLILLGFPIWYYGAPNIVVTFLKQHDLSGKRIGLFATSGGSDIGKTGEKLKPFLGEGAEIVGAKLFAPDTDAETLAAWAEMLGKSE